MTTDAGGSPRSHEVARRRRRRRVAAPLSRIVVAGLSASATFGIVAVMGAVANADGGTAELAPAADPAIGDVPPTTLSTILPTTTRRQVIVVEHLPAETPASAPGSSSARATPPEAASALPASGGALAPAPAVPAAAPTVARKPVTKTKRS